MSEEKPRATFVTFYSFKGGVGRSMALINTAAILAGQRGFRVLAIDVDLEAPGISYLDPGASDEAAAQGQLELPWKSGFVDLLTDATKNGATADLFTLSGEALAEKYTRNIGLLWKSEDFPEGSLRVMPAGHFDGHYANRLNALNIGQLYRDGIGEPLIRVLKKKIAESGLFDYVLVDSRTGLSDEAGMCTRDLADHLMVLSGLNRQNVEGTSEFLRAFRAVTEGKKSIQIILSPVPNGEDKLADEREKVAARVFSDAWKSEVDLSLQIPYHPQLALTEEPHIFRRRRGYLFESYRAIERSMLRMLGHTAQAFHKSLRTSLRKKDHAAALDELQHMVRLEGGERMLSLLAKEIGVNRGDFSTTPTTLETLSSDVCGSAILTTIVQRLPVGEPNVESRGFADKLSKFSVILADKLYLRLIDAAPMDADLLVIYAGFLVDNKSDIDSAEAYYLRALAAAPRDDFVLVNYARFLANSRGELERAEVYHKQALEIDPEDDENLAAYARFLANHRGDLKGAEKYFKRVSDIESQPHLMGDFGQVLAAKGDFEKAEENMIMAFESRALSPDEIGNRAELCFSLWLVARMQGKDGKKWERHFKSLIDRGFKRHSWSFDSMLKKAHTILTKEEFDYAEAMAAAFLNAEKVTDLASFPRWTSLNPVLPSARNSRQRTRKQRN